MKFFGYYIPVDLVVGYSPLWLDSKSADPYGAKQLSFDLYLRQHTLHIQSDIVQTIHPDEKITAYMNDFKARYASLVAEIDHQISLRK